MDDLGKTTDVEIKKCAVCGKPLTRMHEVGSRCATQLKLGGLEGIQARVNAATLPEVPEGFVSLQRVWDFWKESDNPLAKKSLLVKVIGGDTLTNPTADPKIKVVYVGRTRYVPGWMKTQAGIKACTTGNYSKIK